MTFDDFYRLAARAGKFSEISEISVFLCSGDYQDNFYGDQQTHLQIAAHLLNKLLLLAKCR